MANWQQTNQQQKGTDRIRYYQDQLLKAEDFQDDVDCEMNLHNLHIQTVHVTWGVALGFEVQLHSDRGSEQRSLQLGPGLAYDYWGRAILSTRSLQIQLPVSSPRMSRAPHCWVFDLVTRYGDWASLQSGDYPNEERPLWRWSLAGSSDRVNQDFNPPLASDVRLGEEIPLVRLKINQQRDAQTLNFELDFSSRRNVQSLVRPHVATGQINPGSSIGKDRPLLKLTGCPLAWSAQINTASGKFSSAGQSVNPSYFVNLMDHPFSPSSLLAQYKWFQRDELQRLQQQLLGPFVSIQDPTPKQFTLNVRFAASSRKALEDLIKATPALCRTRDFTLPVPVYWFGVEPLQGSPPESLEVLRQYPSWTRFWEVFPIQIMIPSSGLT